MKEDRVYLAYILQCIKKIEEYSQGDKKEFVNNSLVQDAILRRLQTLAESTQRLSDGLKKKMPTIEWRSISGFRNILVHDYLGGIDLDITWEVIDKSLPELKKEIEAILK
ncbi:MAG: DUF86 domain-containing protein [Xenococcus sp. (in: cyanobacteria)]